MQATAYICLVIATLCWGGNSVAGKLALGHISPMMLTFLRWFLAVAMIAVISVPQLRKDWPVVRKNLPLLLFYGVIGYTLFNAMLPVSSVSATNRQRPPLAFCKKKILLFQPRNKKL